MLLTLIRYGFYLSSNSILCLTQEEMEDFDDEGYKIMEKNTRFKATTSQFDYISNVNKDFKIEEKKILTEGIDLLSNKKITKLIIKNNSLLIFEESKNNICQENKNKKCSEFSENESQFDLYFDENFIIKNPDSFYLIIKNNPFYKKNSNNNDCYSNSQLMDIFKEKLDSIINDIFKEMYDGLINEKNIKCIFCQKSLNDISLELYFKTDINNSIIYFHDNYYIENIENNYNNYNNKFNFILFNENEKYKLNDKEKIYEKTKEKILRKDYIISKEEITEFFNSLEEENSINEEFLAELENFKNKLSKDENLKNLIIGEDIRQIKNNNDINDWIETWKKKINQYFKENQKSKWIVLKSYNDDEKTLNYEYKEIDNNKTVYLYNIMPIRNSNDLTLSEKEKFKKEIEDFFPNKDKGLLIYKNGTKNEILAEKSYIFENIYDYDNNSKTLIIYKYEENSKKLAIYVNTGGNKNFKFLYKKKIDLSEIGNSKLNKIMLIPCSSTFEQNENQSVLLFADNTIRNMKIKDSTSGSNGKIIELGDNFTEF